MKRIESKKGLMQLQQRFEEAPKQVDDKKHTCEECTSAYWINVIQGCIEDQLAMDEDDYHNTPSQYKELWKGLK